MPIARLAKELQAEPGTWRIWKDYAEGVRQEGIDVHVYKFLFKNGRVFALSESIVHHEAKVVPGFDVTLKKGGLDWQLWKLEQEQEQVLPWIDDHGKPINSSIIGSIDRDPRRAVNIKSQ